MPGGLPIGKPLRVDIRVSTGEHAAVSVYDGARELLTLVDILATYKRRYSPNGDLGDRTEKTRKNE